MKWIWKHCGRCEEVCLLAAGAVGEEVKLELERHLSGCEECRSYFVDIKALVEPLAAWEKSLSAVEVTPTTRMRWTKAVQETGAPLAVRWSWSAGRALFGGQRSARPTTPPLIRVWGVLWHELIRPNRYAWMGMAVIWLAMFAINGHLTGRSLGGMEANVASSQEIIQDWEEQNRVLAELAQPAFVAPAPRPRIPGPRSQRAGDWVIL